MAHLNSPEWPDIFITGEIPKDREDKIVIADAMRAWANCMMGNTPPDNFGSIMVEIGQRFGILATADGLSDYAKKQGWLP